VPIWGWVVVRVLLLFGVGVVARLADLFGGQSAAQLPTSTEESPTAAPTPIPATAVEPATALPSAAIEISLPSSLGMVPIPGGTYPIAEDRAISVGDYWIDRFEVSDGAFLDFLSDTGQPSPRYWAIKIFPAKWPTILSAWLPGTKHRNIVSERANDCHQRPNGKSRLEARTPCHSRGVRIRRR